MPLMNVHVAPDHDLFAYVYQCTLSQQTIEILRKIDSERKTKQQQHSIAYFQSMVFCFVWQASNVHKKSLTLNTLVAYTIDENRHKNWWKNTGKVYELWQQRNRKNATNLSWFIIATFFLVWHLNIFARASLCIPWKGIKRCRKNDEQKTPSKRNGK